MSPERLRFHGIVNLGSVMLFGETLKKEKYEKLYGNRDEVVNRIFTKVCRDMLGLKDGEELHPEKLGLMLGLKDGEELHPEKLGPMLKSAKQFTEVCNEFVAKFAGYAYAECEMDRLIFSDDEVDAVIDDVVCVALGKNAGADWTEDDLASICCKQEKRYDLWNSLVARSHEVGSYVYNRSLIESS